METDIGQDAGHASASGAHRFETVRFGRSRVVHALAPGDPGWYWTVCDLSCDYGTVTLYDAGAQAVTCRRCLAHNESEG